MDTTATRNVNQIPADEKRTLEHLLGSPLEPDQHVLIITYTPSALPEDETRRAARERIVETMAVNQAFAVSEDVSEAEADAVIDEALSQIRRRP